MKQQAAEALWQARSACETIGPITETYGITSLEEAYAVASINVTKKLSHGARIVGKKIGLTSESVQKQLGVDQPDFGILFDDMEFLNGETLPSERLVQPKAEAEIAFVMAKDLNSTNPSYPEFLDAIGYCLPAIEIVDSMITDWKIQLADTIADNASCGLYVLGDQPVDVGRVDLAAAEMRLFKNGEEVSSGIGSACLGHPLRAAYWLAKIMGQQGTNLKAGEVILSGALGPMVAIASGDKLEVQISTIGNVRCEMS